MDFFLCVIGMVMIVEGLPYFAVPAVMKRWLVAVLGAEDGQLRAAGFFLMLIGLVLVWLGRS